MIWLEDDIVYLSCAEELNVGYVSHSTREGQFTVPQSYQDNPQKFSYRPHLCTGSNDCALGEALDEEVDSSQLEKSRRTGRKRKSRESRSDAQRQSREHEAQQRHMAIHDLLLRAHSTVLQWAQKELGASPETPSRNTVDTAALLPSRVSSRSAVSDEKLDLIALGHMKQAMRPKFTAADEVADAQPRDLFDKLISNDSKQDLVADAAGHPVIMPPRSRFLISDITRLKPLLTGMELVILLRDDNAIAPTTMTGKGITSLQCSAFKAISCMYAGKACGVDLPVQEAPKMALSALSWIHHGRMQVRSAAMPTPLSRPESCWASQSSGSCIRCRSLHTASDA